ncbi:MAG: hypothetical protein AB7U62_17680 [Pseudolabrys sp.]
MTELPPPTDEVRRLVDIVGAEATLALIEAHGGTRFYVPRMPNERLVAIVGEPGAAALASLLGGEYLKLPLARAWRVLVYQARGLSYPAIARRVGCTEGAVWRTLSRHGLTQTQYDLFD